MEIDAAAASSSSSSSSSSTSSGCSAINTACMLFKREVSLGRQYGFSRSQQVHMNCGRTLPMFPQKVRQQDMSGQVSAYRVSLLGESCGVSAITRGWPLPMH
jgi:hypothetical protein